MYEQQITADTVMKEVAKGKPYTLVLLKTGIPLPNDEKLVNKMQMDHLVHLFQMQKDGKISIFGPVTNNPTFIGIVIFNSTNEGYIRKELNDDAYVKDGYINPELYGWFSIPGQKLPD